MSTHTDSADSHPGLTVEDGRDSKGKSSGETSLFEDLVPANQSGCKRFLPISPDITVSVEWGPGGAESPYRYKLFHIWDSRLPVLMMAMMNPSGAGVTKNDSTINLCDYFARFWGYGSLWVGNACALRATQASELIKAADPVGPGNIQALREMAEASDTVVIAHGTLHPKLRVHADNMVNVIRSVRPKLHILGLSLKGFPKHPLQRDGSINRQSKPINWER